MTDSSNCQVQSFLQGGGTLDQLTKELAIKVKRHGVYPELVQLKYDQINSPMGDAIVRECRGIIMDSEDNWKIVARPFDKFFNYGEPNAKPIDWASARVQEKLDGSLMILYHYRKRWNVATSGTPDASGEVNGCGFTFAELFWRVWEEETLAPPDEAFYENNTYMFELMTPYNRVVVRHKENQIRLIGIRNRTTGLEYPVGLLPDNDWQKFELPKHVRSFPLTSFEEIQETFKRIDPFDQEGYVVVDKNFNRVKVKSPAYVAIHHLKDGFGPKRILEIVRQNESTEILAHFPEWNDAFNIVKARYEELVTLLQSVYIELNHIENQKEFALALQAKKLPMMGAIFALRAKKTPDLKTFLAQVPIDSLGDALNIKEIKF